MEIDSGISTIKAEVRRKGKILVSSSATHIEGNTKANIRKHGLIDTGFMLGSVQARPVSEMVWEVVIGAVYAIYHEYGTRYLPARPFFRPAVDFVMPVFVKGVQMLMDEAAREAERKVS